MKRAFSLAIAVAALGLAGCASLRVSVDVLDPQHVQAEMADERVRKLLRAITKADPGELAAGAERAFQAYQLEVVKLANSYDALGKTLSEDDGAELMNVAEDLRTAVAGPSRAAIQTEHGIGIEQLAQEIRQAGATLKWIGQGSIPTSLRDLLTQFAALSKKRVVEQQRDISELIRHKQQVLARRLATTPAPSAAAAKLAAANTNTPQARAAVAQEAATVAVTRRSIIEGSEITHTEFAHVVANAPDKLWAKNFNQAYGNGSFGNVDIVIRMNSTADFSLKGMRFDASTVAQVASKVMTQSLLIGAQLSGVPVPTARSASGAAATGGEALSGASSDLAGLQASLARRQAQAEAQRDAVRAAARSILGSRAQMDAAEFDAKGKADDSRSAMHKGIDATLTALRPLLSMQDIQ